MSERKENLGIGGVPQPISWTMTATAKPHAVSDFEAVLLAMAGHDLRQPLQVIQNAYELLGLGVRTRAELRHLRSGQNAVDRLKGQLEQLLTALRLRECGKEAELKPVRVHQVLRQACQENYELALKKGISIRLVPTDASVLSDGLLLGAVLRNLVSNAVKYTQPGGRILLGCRHYGSSLRVDVYDTGIGIPGEQVPEIFEAFTRLDIARHDSLGIGLFIVRQAIGLLGHRVDVASTPGRGSRFSVFVTRVGRGGDQARASRSENTNTKKWEDHREVHVGEP
jgi:two-component system, OmpR family, phosphate regulon sensor histidine kinase PhoR